MAALLFLGYGGYYFCRVDLSVALPLIISELGARGLDRGTAVIRMGTVVSFGVLAYAAGKFLLAGIADFLGGKRNFLGGMAGAIIFTVLFALSGSLPLFTLAWIGNRFVQAGGWPGLVKIASRWFNYSSYGAVMAVLSISFLVGDAAARQIMGAMIRAGFGWRSLFFFAAGFLGMVLVLNLVFLRDAREDLGFAPAVVNPMNVFSLEQDLTRPRGIMPLLSPLLTSPSFLLVCFLSLGCTLVRETFNTWIPTYFTQAIGMSNADAAKWSALFPWTGAVSVLLAGWVSDRLGAGSRALVMFVGLTIAGIASMGLGSAHGRATAETLVGVIAFGLLGPYSYLAGAMAMDFGGRQGGAASSGLIDGIGYLGGILAGDSFARVAVGFGWPSALNALGGVCLISAGAAAILLFKQRRQRSDGDRHDIPDLR